MKKQVCFLFCCLLCLGSHSHAQQVKWVTTSPMEKFALQNGLTITDTGSYSTEVNTDQPLQTITGFGGCFNELGWQSLGLLSDADRQSVMKELFEPGLGGCFNICRMPVGANDFSLQWYSYNETDGDFAMKHFSIANDLKTLVPFIKTAQQYNPSLKVWASPWSPPQWMKYNHHYAEAMYAPGSRYQNGIRADQVGQPGTDMFIQEDRYFEAYALYFQRFIDAYRRQGIPISMVMPQNEFLSAQVFPSCTWTASGLEKFLTFLVPKMQKQQVGVFFGTMNGSNEKVADTILNSPRVGKHITGIGLQWAGKGAVAGIHQRYPGLAIYQSEQECGNGKNDWQYCCYTWDLIKHYLSNGANAYMYWNIALAKDGMSHWGWRQNSLVTIDSVARTYHWNDEYYLLKHVSHFVKPGARLLPVTGAFHNMLAFRNPDKSIVLVIRNDSKENRQVSVRVGKKTIAPVLKPDSFNTIVLN